MRDCVFFVADKSMSETFAGFFSRPDRCQQLNCGPFEFVRSEDLFVAAGQNDPGLYTRADELLRPFQNSHRRAVVALDCDWDGSPGQAAILDAIARQMMESGWDGERFVVIAIEPELEQWIWQDSTVLETALRHQGPPSLRSVLAQRDLWPAGLAKPPQPKEAFIQVQHENGVKKSSAIFGRIAKEVQIAGCTDAEFLKLAQTLRAWFPPEAEA